MFDGGWIGEFIAGIIYLIIGYRLLQLASRTGERPERLLSFMFFFSGASYLIYIVPMVIPIDALWTPFNFAGRVIYIPAPILLAMFTRDVFRRDSRFSTGMVYATTALLVVGVSVSAMLGDWEGFSLGSPFFWLEWVAYTLPFCWAAAEAFHRYLQARRRGRVGLGGPSVCNRMLLWSLFGLILVLSSLVVVGQYAAYERENVFSSIWDNLYRGTALTALVVMWIAFFPPAIYVRWVNRSTERSAAEQA